MIGFSGPVEEKEKRKDHSDSIIDGIGKSSFCARFIKPHQVKNGLGRSDFGLGQIWPSYIGHF